MWLEEGGREGRRKEVQEVMGRPPARGLQTSVNTGVGWGCGQGLSGSGMDMTYFPQDRSG